MSYGLSFSEEFFIGPYDLNMVYDPVSGEIESVDDDGETVVTDEPTSLYQAISVMSVEDWESFLSDVGLGTETTDVSLAISMAREVNTCSNINSPVEVWLDSEGYHTVKVY